MMFIDGGPTGYDLDTWKAWLVTLQTESPYVENSRDAGVVMAIERAVRVIELLEEIELDELTKP